MLILCPECALQISDKAISCPHCGYPLDKKTIKRQYVKRAKRKRLPNGFGQISEIKNKRLRKPFRAMITVGKDSQGKYIRKLLKPECYFETYNDAYAALIDYNRNPYDLEKDITVEQLYERWSHEYFETINVSTKRTITAAWAYCNSVYDMRVSDLRARHIKGCMENGIVIRNNQEITPSVNIKGRIKSVFNVMLDYAVEYEIVDRNYARTFKISDDIIKEQKENKKKHIPYTLDELDILWNNVNKVAYLDILLIQCYSGWRPQEIGLIKIDDVNLEKGTMIGGLKTESGKQRIVPIHDKIKHLVEYRYNEAQQLNSEYLFNCTDGKNKNNIKMTYYRYADRVNAIISEFNLNPNHRPHDGRNTFVTLAKKYHVDEYAIKYIIGHKIQDLTENVYTKREISWLIDEMKKIK